MANILERLTEGTVSYDKRRETAGLVAKWEKSGLLEGINDEFKRGSMALMLENQAKELLREANAMSAGDVQGFASVAFPIVRRVFAGLIANDLVSVQPMSLPSGLVFFMDFKHGTQLGLTGDEVRKTTESLYGDRIGEQVRYGVRVNGNDYAEKGYYALGSGYGTARMLENVSYSDFTTILAPITVSGALAANKGDLFRFDADLVAEPSSGIAVYDLALSALDYGALIAEQDVFSFSIASGSVVQGVVPSSAETWTAWTQSGSLSTTALGNATIGKLVHRLTKVIGTGLAGDAKKVRLVFFGGDKNTQINSTFNAIAVQYPVKDEINNAPTSALGALQASQPWTLEGSTELPEIQLKVDSFSITARSRKLKAAWTPELGQDLNAYHNLDAEVELTSILSEQIGLEIDQEILNDLIKGQTGGIKYWSRRPGNFVNRLTGEAFATSEASAILPPDFTGNVSMWYETLLETINDVSADIHRKTLRGGANFIVVSPEVANILEFTAGFRATVTHDSDKGTTGAVKVGALNSKFDVIVDPYFPRNVILVGRKGASFLESGYVYSPYVPLQTTPTIFDPKDFTPRKAVMTRYGKAFVRPDMFGLVVVKDLLG